MQILLPLQKLQGFINAIDPDVGPGILFHEIAAIVAARGFKADLGHLIAAVTLVRQ